MKQIKEYEYEYEPNRAHSLMSSRLAQGSSSARLLQDLQELSREVRLLQENCHSRNVSYNISGEVRDSPFQYECPVEHTGQACRSRAGPSTLLNSL